MLSCATGCIIYSCCRWLRDLTIRSWNALTFLNEFLWTPRCSVGKQISFTSTVCFSQKKRRACSCRMHHDVQCLLLHSPLHVTMHVLSNQYRTRESEIEQVPVYSSRREKLKKKKELTKHKIAQKWSSYYVQFTKGSIKYIENKKSHWNIFCNDCHDIFKYICVVQREYDL